MLRFSFQSAGLTLALTALTAPAAAQDHVVIGPAAVAGPSYEGADKYRVLPIPIVDITRGRLFLDTVDGLGIDVIKAGPLTVGGSIGYVPGYRRRDVPDGIGHLPDTAGARLFTTYAGNGIRLTVGGTRSIGGTHGTTVDATLSYTVKLSSRFSLAPTAATSWANRKFNDRYFGVSARQSRASGLDSFMPGSGFKDVTLGLTAKYAMSPRWFLIANASERGLLGDDADSPIVENKWRPLGSFGLGHAF